VDLRDYLRIFSRNWLLIVGCTLVGLLIGGGVSIATKPTYTAETQLFVAIQNSGSVQELQQGNTFSQARVQSYVKAVNSPIVLQPVIDNLGLGVTADELSKSVKGTTDVNTVLINIEASDSSAVRSAAIAQGVANSLIDAIEKIEKPKNGGSSPFNVSVIKPAVAPSTPASPNTRLNLILGFVLGVGFGLATAVVRTRLDNKVRGEADVRRVTDSPVLGGISYDANASRQPLLTQTATQSPRAESFRQLRTNLQFANVAKGAKTVLVTSSVPGEGKSTTATNLAIAMAQAGQAVCLIDADLRRPMVSEYLGIDRNAGLTTALIGHADVKELLQPWGEDELFVLASGQIPPNPSELLGSKVMRELLEDLEQVFDTVIIDAPPLLPVTDAAVLSQHVGGVILVVGSQKLRQQELEKSLSALDMVGSDVLGIVLNRLPAKGPDAYSYSYYRNENHESLEKMKIRGTRESLWQSEAASTEDVLASTDARWARPPRTFPTGNSQD